MDSATGFTEIALATRVLLVVAVVTVLFVIVGYVIDRSAERPTRSKDR